MDDGLVTFLAQRYAEEWSAARDRELAAGLDTCRATRDIDAKRAIIAGYVDACRAFERAQVALASARRKDKSEAERKCTETWGIMWGVTWAVRRLGAVYSDHPDYPEGRPQSSIPSPASS